MYRTVAVPEQGRTPLRGDRPVREPGVRPAHELLAEASGRPERPLERLQGV
ncbi:hypothetical protein ACH41C_19175 [Streptomyces althioticus]|uniref:hypothetical protein n=1 Tax=Streptomyces TaxID=1883 RepID=UPI0033D7A090